MIEATNARVMSIVTPKVEDYIKQNMVGFMSTCVMVCNVDEEVQRVKLLLTDKDDDVGTYQFYKDEKGNLVVADYFNEDLVFSSYNTMQGSVFNADYDLPVSYNNIMSFLELLENNHAYMFIGIEDDVIQHEDLMVREGWNDRRIKSTFGTIARDDFGDRWYSLREVMRNEVSH